MSHFLVLVKRSAVIWTWTFQHATKLLLVVVRKGIVCKGVPSRPWGAKRG